VRFEVLTDALLKIQRIVLTSQLLQEFRPIVLLFSSGSGNPTSGLLTVRIKRTLQTVAVAIYESKQPNISEDPNLRSLPCQLGFSVKPLLLQGSTEHTFKVLFTFVPCILLLSKFCYQLMHKRIDCSQVPNSAADTHQQALDNICSHTTRLTTVMYFIRLF